MIKQQIDLTKTFSSSVRRVTVLIRAADLVWPYQQGRARAAFAEAFELAADDEKENASKAPRSILLRLQVPDQRYVVIRAVAKRDPAWAKELTRQTLKSDREIPSTKDPLREVITAERLFDSANRLIATDIQAALDLARMSLRYPASAGLTHFLYKLADVDQQAADRFYTEALGVYGDRPMREFLYLQAYPFGLRDSLDTPIFAFYQVPAKFVTNQVLQRHLVQALLRRTQQALEEPSEQHDVYRDQSARLTPGIVHLFQALVRLEPHVRASLPDSLAALIDAREKVLVSLSVETQKQLLQPGREASVSPDLTFDEQIETAQKLADVDERDELMGVAVLSELSNKENLERVIEVIDKISDSKVRTHLPEIIYFRRATAAINARQFEEAERLAARVEGHEQRAFLHVEIAKGLLRTSDTQAQAQELLEQAITEANKAGVTIFAARTLLTASTLYAKIDLSRAISVLADAIKCVNRLESPDFVSDGQAQEKRVPRPDGAGHFVLRFYMPGLDPESAFRDMAKIDFDTAASQSSGLTDKFQRALSTLAVAESCLQQRPSPPKRRSLQD